MKITGVTFVAVSTLAVFATATAVRAQDKMKPTERAVTISGCVVAGEQKTFMLKDVKQVGGWAVPEPTATFWLNTTKGLEARLGQRVEVSGIVDFKDKHEGQTKVTVDPEATKDTTTKVTSGDREVKVKEDKLPKVDAAETMKTRTPSVVYDLHVKSLTTVPGSCAGK